MSSKKAALTATVTTIRKISSHILENKRIKNSGVVKTPKQLERHFKGVANHWRISILLLISKNKNLTVENIATSLNGNIKTISAHTQKLVQAGLVEKKYAGTAVMHSLSPYGESMVRLIALF